MNIFLKKRVDAWAHQCVGNGHTLQAVHALSPGSQTPAFKTTLESSRRPLHP